MFLRKENKCISKINCKIVKLKLHWVAQLKKYAPVSSCEKFPTIENKTDEICNTIGIFINDDRNGKYFTTVESK